MITLPRFPPRRAWLRSFWIVISLVSGSMVSILCVLLISPRWFASGVVLVLVMAVPGLLRPQIASLPYRTWNKLARGVVRVARLWVTGVCFYIIFVTVGLTGSHARLVQPTSNGSLWVARRTPASTAYGLKHDGVPQEFAQKGWIRAYLVWARQPGNLWAVCLLPFLILISALENDRNQNPVAANIYTLF
jgi:hypothetical protein